MEVALFKILFGKLDIRLAMDVCQPAFGPPNPAGELGDSGSSRSRWLLQWRHIRVMLVLNSDIMSTKNQNRSLNQLQVDINDSNLQ